MKNNSLHELYYEYLCGYRRQEDAVDLVKNILGKAQAAHSEAYIQCANGSLCLLAGDYEKANDFFKRSIKIDSNFALPWFELGSIAYEQKQYRKSAAHFKKAIKIDYRLAPAWERLGVIFSIKKKYEKAELFLKKSIEIDDKNANAWNSLGIVYYEKKDFTRAMEYYKKALEIDNTSPNPYTNIGIIYANQKNFEEAEHYFKKAIEIDNRLSNQWNNLGCIYYEQGNDTEAERCYLKAIQLNENYSLSFLNMGRLLRDEKRYEDAWEYLNRALVLFNKEKDKRRISETKSLMNSVLREVNPPASKQGKQESLSWDLFLSAIQLLFFWECIVFIALAGFTLYGILFEWTSEVIKWVEDLLISMLILFGLSAIFLIVYKSRDRIPKGLIVLLNSLAWIYLRFLLPWIFLGFGIYAIPTMDLGFSGQLMGYAILAIFTMLFFKMNNPLFLLKVINQPRLQTYTFSGSVASNAFRMVHISDIHATGAQDGKTNDGKFFSSSHLKEKFERLKHLEWDVLVLTGDMTDSGGESDWDIFCSCMGDLPSARPVILLPGNHDIILAKGLRVDGIGEQIQLRMCRFLKYLNRFLSAEFLSIKKGSTKLISSRELLAKQMPFIENYLLYPPTFSGVRDIDVNLNPSPGKDVCIIEGADFRRPQRILENIYPLALPVNSDFLVVALNSPQHEDSAKFFVENAIGCIRQDQIDRLIRVVTEIAPRCLVIALHHHPGVFKKNILKLALSLLDSREFLKICLSLNCRLILSGHVHDRHFYQFGDIPIFCSGASITYSKSFPIYTIDKDFHLSKGVISI
jgi:tetratricopeptide (TPR) repeat protein/predicted MPP superfamily phosphohydrolase